MEKKPITQKSWDDFRAAGLLWFVNSVLHVFGWAIVVVVDEGKVKDVYPARVTFRGFDESSQGEEHVKLADWLSENASELKDEAKEANS